jgi:hypothetical protein
MKVEEPKARPDAEIKELREKQLDKEWPYVGN